MNYKTIILFIAIFAQVVLLTLKAAESHISWWLVASPALTGLAYIAVALIGAALVNKKNR